MAGKIIRFPGRPRSTPEQREAGKAPSEEANNNVGSLLRECVAAKASTLPSDLSIANL